MEKLKNILKTGHSAPAEDEQLYGTSDPLNHPAGGNDPQLHSSEKAKKDTGLMRQILNPGGDKYDETRFTQTASTDAPVDTIAGGNEEALQSTERAHKDGGVMRQILNPGGDKYDETRFTTTGATPSAAPDAGLEPQTGSASGTAGGYSTHPSQLLSSQTPHGDGGSTASIKSGVQGYPQTSTTSTSQPNTSSYTSGGSQLPSHQHNRYGQDAALAGGSALAGGAALGAGRRTDSSGPDRPLTGGPAESHHEGFAHVQGTTTARKYSLGGSRRPENIGGTSTATQSTGYAHEPTTHGRDPAVAVDSQQQSSGGLRGAVASAASAIGLGGSTTGSNTATHDTTARSDANTSSAAPQQSNTQQSNTQQSSGGLQAAVASAAGALGLGGYAASKSHQEPQQPATYQPTGSSANPAAVAAARSAAQQSQGSGDQNASYASVPYHAPGPHETDIANRLDPNVDTVALAGARNAPSAYARDEPTSTTTRGTDPVAQGAARLAPSAAARDEQSSHVGRDAGLAGGAAALAGGAYAADRSRDPNEGTQTSGASQADSGPASRTIGPHKSDVLNVLDPRVQPQPELMKGSSKGTNQTATDPAPHTVGPHSSDAANVVDPRVQPQPKKQQSSRAGATATDPAPHTVGPHQSDTLNVLDPRVQPQPEKQGARDREGSGALGAAGVGAGAGALGAGALTSGEGDSYQDHGPLTDRHQGYQGWQNPYSSAAVDPRLDDMPGSFPETPGEQPTRAAPSEQQQQPQQRGSGLGTAGAAGLTGAGIGAGAYEASKLRDRDDEPPRDRSALASTNTPSASQGASTTSALPTQRAQNTTNNPSVGTALTSDQAVPSQTHREFTRGPDYGAAPRDQDVEEQSRDHHYGRDALVAGGVGAAGVGTYEAAKDYERSKAPMSNKEIYGEDAVKPKPVQQQTQAGNASSTEASGPTGPIYGNFNQKSAQQPTSGTSGDDRHYGRDAALAGGAGAAGLGAYQASKPDSSSQPSSTREIYGDDAVTPKRVAGTSTTQREQDPTTATQSNDHHYGRDAALAGGAGAAGLGAYEASKSHPGASTQQQTGAPSSTREIYGDDAVTPKRVAGATGTQQSSQTASGPTADDRHYGRDAALVGGTGAAGLGAHEASKQHPGQGTGAPSSSAAGASTSQQPLSTREIYGDEAVKPKPVAGASSGQQSQQPSAGGSSDDRHYGRDAAIAGGTGAAGLGAYEASKHGGSSQPATSSGQSQASPPANLRAAHNIYPPELFQSQPHQPTTAATAGGLSGDSATGEAERARQQAQQSSEQPHHYGRDAAIAGGAGAVGVGGYEASKQGWHAGPTGSAVPSGQQSQGQSYNQTAQAPQQGGYGISGQNSKAFQQASQGTGAEYEQPRQAPQPPTSEHHYGRDAALASGAGAAGIGAYDYAHKPTEAQRDPVSALQGGVTHGFDDQRAAPHTGSQHFDPVRGGTLDEDGVSHPHGHTHPPYNPGVAPAEQPEVHRKGRDAAVASAVGGGMAGAGMAGAGFGAQPTQPGEERLTGKSRDTQQSSQAPTTQAQQQQSGHHYGRDTALAGGAGAAGLGAYEASKHDGAESAQQTKFDPMNPTGVQHHGPFHHHQKPGQEQQAGQASTSEADPQTQGHHYGRDAAIAGGAGATGLGAYEASKHEGGESAQQTKFDPMNPTGVQHHGPFHHHGAGQEQQAGQTSTGQADQQTQGHHYGRDAAVVGGAGALGAGAYGASKQHPSPTATGVAAGHEHTKPSLLNAFGAHHHKKAADTPQTSGTHGAAVSQQTQQPSQGHHYGRDAALTTGGAGIAGVGGYEALKHGGSAQQGTAPQQASRAQQPSAIQTGVGQTSATGPSQHPRHQHTPSGTSSRYSDENVTPDSPSSGKRKHKILTFLNKKEDKDSSPRSSMDKDHGNRGAYTDPNNSRGDEAQQSSAPLAGSQAGYGTEQQGALHGLGGPEGHEYGAQQPDEGLSGSTGGLSHSGSVVNRGGHNVLHKEPPKKWVEEHLSGQQGGESSAPGAGQAASRID